jgi:hypothetical protein
MEVTFELTLLPKIMTECWVVSLRASTTARPSFPEPPDTAMMAMVPVRFRSKQMEMKGAFGLFQPRRIRRIPLGYI